MLLKKNNIIKKFTLIFTLLPCIGIISQNIEAATAKKVKRNKSNSKILFLGATGNYNLYMPCFDDEAISCVTNGVGFRAFVGYQFSGSSQGKAALRKRSSNKKQTAFRIETGFATYGGTETIGLNSSTQDTSVMGLDLALSYNTLLMKGKYNIYGKLGAGFNLINTSLQTDKSAVTSAILSITPSFGFGFEYHLLPTLAARTEFSFIYGVGADSGFGQANISMLQLGLTYFTNSPVLQKGRKKRSSRRRR
jgi:hypothetical protein